MKQFFKVILASALGTLLGLLGLLVVLSGVMAGASMLAQKGDTDEVGFGPVPDSSVLLVPIDGVLKDRGRRPDFFSQFNPVQDPPEIGLYEITETLREAAQDKKVKGLLLHIKNLRSGLANAEALRREIVKFKESGKFVMAYSEVYTELGYLVASAADDVILYPRGYFEWDGLFTTLSFFQGTLKKLDVVPQVLRVGKYKSAIEPFINEKMSPESREQLDEIISNAWDRVRFYAMEKTKLSAEELDDLAEQASVVTAQAAFAKGFVGQLASFEEVEKKLLELVGEDEEVPYSNWRAYHQQMKDRSSDDDDDQIAVVFAEGGISTDAEDDESISSDHLSPLLDKLRKDEDVKAVVLRVNSPGGSALASDVIWTSTQWLKDAKPIVTSFGNVAASGGYYMSAGSHYIFAEPTTITGSIGVFGLVFATEDFFNRKVGMTFDTLKSHRFSDMEALVRELDPAERLKMQTLVDQIYEDFLSVVMKGRKSFQEREQAHKVAQGRVWTGQRAQELGLVDELGGLQEAVVKAAELAGVKDYQVVTYPKSKSPFEQFLSQLGGVSSGLLMSLLPESLQGVQKVFNQESTPLHEKVELRLPYDIVIQ